MLTAFGVTTWAVNRVGWAFGYNRYDNPYAVVVVDNGSYNYSEPLVMTPDETTLAADPDDTSPAPVPSEEGMSNFDTAQKQFHDGDYESALRSVDAALNELPDDAVVHEFRALVLFALGKYLDAAATLYAVLSVGPGWDWTTMSSLYPNVSVYTEQLRKLESVRRANTDDAAACFVLAYHYITCNHNDAAISQLKNWSRCSRGINWRRICSSNLTPTRKFPISRKSPSRPKRLPQFRKRNCRGTGR